MRRSGLPAVAWVLLGLLAVAAGLMSLGHQDLSADPDSLSYGPSGVSAFVELLRRSGVEVSINQESRPKLAPGDVAVAFKILRRPEVSLSGVAGKPEEDPFADRFWARIKAGGRGIVLPLAENYLDASRLTKTTPFLPVRDLGSGKSFDVTAAPVSDQNPFDSAPPQAVHMDLWTEDDQPFVRAYRYGKGTALVVRDGIGLTNRFIDQNDNAKAFRSLFAMLAQGSRRIVFTEASFGHVNDPDCLKQSDLGSTPPGSKFSFSAW